LFDRSEGIRVDLKKDDVYTFNSVDGGLINNEPFGVCMKVLIEKNKTIREDDNYAIIMVDPFPNQDHEADSFDTKRDIISIAKGMFKALRNQVMFNQDGILDALALNDRTKFLVEPIKKIEDENGEWVRAESDLASAPISGFAGFLNQDFRKHDFQLGRKNCQIFLRYYFAVAEENIESRLCKVATDQARERFEYALPPKDPQGKRFFPIIPDMRVLKNFDGQVDEETYGEDSRIKLQPFPKMSFSTFENKYKKLIKKRIGKLTKGLIKNQFFAGLISFFFAKRKGYKVVRESLYNSLKESDLLEKEH